MFPISAGLGALSYLTSLLQSSTAATGSSQSGNILSQLGQALGDGDGDKQSGTSAVGSGGTTQPFNPGMLASLIALQGQNGDGTKAQGLFSKLDTDGDGKISQSEFESALGANGVDTKSADALFSKLDTNGDGSVSQSELAAARHGHHHQQANGLSSQLNATGANGAKTETTTNPDGSTTTTITYADGSTISTTTAASSSGSDSSGGSSDGSSGGSKPINLLEQLIKLQAQYLSQQSTSGGVSTTA